MEWTPSSVIRWLFDSRSGPTDRFLSRWIFLRALGAIYFSAFFSLVFQIRGLIGPQGILPASEYLKGIAEQVGHARYWYVPTVLWFSSSSHMLTGLCWVGMAAAILLVLNIWPRGMLTICFVCFLSFVSAAGDFSGYQSDGMLLEAGFLSLFLAPGGFRPGLGEKQPPVRTALYLLLWEWFRIYFESGVAKIAGQRPRVAQLHGIGRVLSKWAAANLDRLVRTAFSALVSHRINILYAGARTGFHLGSISAAAVSHRAFLHRYAVADRHHSHCQLHLSELSRSHSSAFLLLDDRFLAAIFLREIGHSRSSPSQSRFLPNPLRLPLINSRFWRRHRLH